MEDCAVLTAVGVHIDLTRDAALETKPSERASGSTNFTTGEALTGVAFSHGFAKGMSSIAGCLTILPSGSQSAGSARRNSFVGWALETR